MEIDRLLSDEGRYTPPSPPQRQLFSIEQIREELQDALDSDFEFTGNFYYSEHESAAPNPCLYVDGPGPIGLPLNERDARATIEHSSHAPFGRRDQTIVDTHVRDTWEIDPANFRFENPAWQPFIDGVVVKKVWSALGVAEPNTPPRCELYKLLLYESGSHFLPHQDTEKTKGMFATIIIILPSAYTGGQVHLQHDGKTEILDMSHHSHFDTSVLAWYTDVMHEVKPITSGYRLALSYNLIHSSLTAVPQASGPNPATSRLRAVLSKWSTSSPPSGESNLLLNLLKHQYTESNLKDGVKTLKGEDAHLMTHLKPILDELGFSAFLGQLVYHLSGPSASGPWDNYSGYGKRGRYDDYYDDEEDDGDEDDEGSNAAPTPSDSSDGLSGFVEIDEKELKIEHLVDLEGNEVQLCDDPIEIEDINMIPKLPFHKVGPDEEEDEGYTGNEGGTLEHWYHRTVLLLIPECSADEIIFSSAGFSYALTRLNRSSPSFPTARERKAVDGIVDILVGRDKKAATMMADLAVEWNDLAMWRRVMKEAFDSFEALGVERLVQAWRKFGFSNVQSSFEALMTLSHKSLKNRMDTLHTLVSHATPEEHEAMKGWCAIQEDRILKCFASPNVDDIPYLLDAGRSRGSELLYQNILPQLVGKTSTPFDFMIKFVTVIHENRKAISRADGRESFGTSETEINTVIGRCLDTAWTEWNKVIAPSDTSDYYRRAAASRSPTTVNLRIDRVVTVLDLYLTTNHTASCTKLHALLEEQESDKQTLFRVLHIPLFKKIIPMLHKHNLRITTPPFDHFFRTLSQKYLEGLLPLAPTSGWLEPRVFGCGCEDCQTVNAFIADQNSSEQLFRMVQKRRLHIEHGLYGFSDLATFATVRTGSPHGVQVKKISAKEKRQAQILDARSFLRNLGGEKDVLELLGEQTPDLRVVLQGASGQGATSGSKPAPSAGKPTLPVAGQKRKKAAIKPTASKNLGVIDLTLSD